MSRRCIPTLIALVATSFCLRANSQENAFTPENLAAIRQAVDRSDAAGLLRIAERVGPRVPLVEAGCKPELVRALVATFSPPADDLNPALSSAANEGCLEVIEVLVAYGANVNTLTNSRASPYRASALDRALQAGHADVARRLIQMGARPNLSDADRVAMIAQRRDAMQQSGDAGEQLPDPSRVLTYSSVAQQMPSRASTVPSDESTEAVPERRPVDTAAAILQGLTQGLANAQQQEANMQRRDAEAQRAQQERYEQVQREAQAIQAEQLRQQQAQADANLRNSQQQRGQSGAPPQGVRNDRPVFAGEGQYPNGALHNGEFISAGYYYATNKYANCLSVSQEAADTQGYFEVRVRNACSERLVVYYSTDRYQNSVFGGAGQPGSSYALPFKVGERVGGFFPCLNTTGGFYHRDTGYCFEPM